MLIDEGKFFVELVLPMPAKGRARPAATDRHAVVYDADFRDGAHYGLVKDNVGDAKRLDESDRAWAAGQPAPPPARDVFDSLFPGAAKVVVDNAWLCRRRLA